MGSFNKNIVLIAGMLEILDTWIVYQCFLTTILKTYLLQLAQNIVTSS